VANNSSSYPTGDSHPSQAGNLKATGEFVTVLNTFYNAWKAGTMVPQSLAVDSVAGNGVLDPGETVAVSPTWMNLSAAPVTLTGTASSFVGPPSAVYSLPDTSAAYGSIAAGASASCAGATANCYLLQVSVPATRPSVHWDASFTEDAVDRAGQGVDGSHRR